MQIKLCYNIIMPNAVIEYTFKEALDYTVELQIYLIHKYIRFHFTRKRIRVQSSYICTKLLMHSVRMLGVYFTNCMLHYDVYWSC